MGLNNGQRLKMLKIAAVSEASLGPKRIIDVFDPSFFKTNFWYMWATTFGFQPWHSAAELKRYMHRFIQEFPRFHTLAGVRRTPYNQYDSIVLPLTEWLKAQGVRFELGTRVTNLDFRYGRGEKGRERLYYIGAGVGQKMAVGLDDMVFVTNGSLAAPSSLGAMTTPPKLLGKEADGSGALGEPLAAKHSDGGGPA